MLIICVGECVGGPYLEVTKWSWARVTSKVLFDNESMIVMMTCDLSQKNLKLKFVNTFGGGVKTGFVILNKYFLE